MFDRIMGNQLLEKGRISREVLARVYRTQENRSARLGVIAVAERLITMAQAEEINAIQAVEDKRFGDIAIEKRYLTPQQVERLLRLQTNRFMSFSQALVDSGAISLGTLEHEVAEYQNKRGLTASDMALLKSCDIELCAPIFMNTQDPVVRRLGLIGIRNIYRLADHHITVDMAEKTVNLKEETAGYQRLTGQEHALVAIVGKSEDIRALAIAYTNEDLIETKEDALDAVCELINCVNGIYATERSVENVKVEIEPPEFKTLYCNLSAKELMVLPIRLSSGHEIKLVITSDPDAIAN